MTAAAPDPLAILDRPLPEKRVGTALAAFRSAGGGVSAGVVLSVLGAAAVGAVMVVDHRPGLGLALAGMLLWVPVVPVLVRRSAWTALMSAALSIALLAMVAIRSAEWVVVLCLMAAAGMAAVAVTAARSAPGVLLALPTAFPAAGRGLRWAANGLREAAAGRRGSLLGLVRTAAVTLVLLVVFGLLLTSADAVFATFLPRPDLPLLPFQIVLAGLLALLGLAAVSSVLSPPTWSTVTPARPRAARRVEWFTPVLAVAALMVAFLLTQVVAAVGGDRYVLQAAGLSYAQYARQGFGQLVAVTALTLAVVAWFARRAPREERQDRMATRVALGLLCLAALGVVVTALSRMALYVQAYGLTELRILATAGEIVMGVVLLLVLVAGVRWRGGWLPVAAVQVAAAAILALALVNPEGLMVQYNTQAQDAPLDVWHLSALSEDAVPQIDLLDEPDRTCLLGFHDSEVDPSVWGWNLSRSQAVAIDDVPTAGSCSRGW